MAAEQSSGWMNTGVSRARWLQQEQEILSIVDTAIADGGPIPVYKAIGEQVEVSPNRVGRVIKKSHRQEILNELRGGPQISVQNIRIRTIFWNALRRDEPPPVYSAVGEKVGVTTTRVERVVVRDDELRQALAQKREEYAVVTPEMGFPKSDETAWFLGMLVGTGGSVDMSRGTLAFSSRKNDTYKLEAFKNSGEYVLGQWKPPYDRPAIVGIEEHVGNNAHPSMVFSSKPHIRALGPFTKDERAGTMRERHGWVESPEFIESYISGIFDSGGKLRTSGDQIDFNTTSEKLAEYYINLFEKLGIQRSHKTYHTQLGERVLRGVTIQNKKDLQLFAGIITSKNPFIQEQLNALK